MIESFLSCELEAISSFPPRDRSCGGRLRMRDLTESMDLEKVVLDTCVIPNMIRMICNAPCCYHEKGRCSRRGGMVLTKQRCCRGRVTDPRQVVLCLEG
jgi:hypothetical protein